MKTTDYSKIAAGYDRNPLRRLIPRDPLLETLLEGNPRTIVDLACGTGNYLQSQMEHFGTARTRWIGVDLSPDMLARAREKTLGAELLLANAQDLPLADSSVDFVKVRFAHHHFTDKPRAFAEVYRILKTGGRVSVFNICHEYSQRAWVYHYFPATQAIDADRFPTTFEFHRLLTELGFAVDTEISVKVTEHPYSDLITEVRNRDMSQLNLLDEADYQAGLAALVQDAQTAESFWGDVALVNVTATKA